LQVIEVAKEEEIIGEDESPAAAGSGTTEDADDLNAYSYEG